MNKRLAIKGHPKEGNKVIEILEMLGGKDVGYGGIGSHYYYYIDEYANIAGTTELPENKTFVTYTLEELLEKFPYKIGNKVTLSDYESPLEVVGMKWKDNSIKYEVYTNDYGYWFSVDELQPYKEETMEEKDKTKALNLIGEDYCGKRFVYKIPNGYELDCIKDNEIILKPKQPQYPKTYEECAKELGYNQVMPTDHILGYKGTLLSFFQQLLICRDAYWQIAGEELELGKPWEPLDAKDKYIIRRVGDAIVKCYNISCVLEFPTAEMRDAFYEHFKELIEQCKQLL